MNNYFKSKGYLESGIITSQHHDELDMRTLPPILRVLLITDGTVTKTLEAYFWEPVLVKGIKQKTVLLRDRHHPLATLKNETVLQRNVKLVGKISGSLYAKAESTIRLQHLPADIRENLIAEKMGIGELLRESGLETYRELIDIGQEENNLIYRTYQIIIDQIPTITVTEHFPLAQYQQQEMKGTSK